MKLNLLWLFAISAVLGTPSVGAAIISYSGESFTALITTDDELPERYLTTDSINGFIELSNPLAPNTVLASVIPIDFSFFDGVHVINSANFTDAEFIFSTDLAGNIMFWNINLRHFAPLGGDLYSQATMAIHATDDDLAADLACASDAGPITTCSLFGPVTYGQAASTEAPGAWSISTVPIPGSVLLFASPAAMLFLRWSNAARPLRIRMRPDEKMTDPKLPT